MPTTAATPKSTDSMRNSQADMLSFYTFPSKTAPANWPENNCKQGICNTFTLCYFTGKERDEETGYSYFTARYLDHEILTSFLSVDRYADKYPSISPYAYCVWNPIRLTDPSGDSISYKLGDIEYHYTQTDNGYAWKDRNGNTYTGNDKYLNEVTSALGKLQEKPIGEQLVGDIINDAKTVQIVIGRSNGADAEKGEWVRYNPFKTQCAINEDGTRNRPAFIGLGHELAHIDDTWHGTVDQSEWFTTCKSNIVVPMCEISVCEIENKIRAEHGISRRAFYFYYNSDGVTCKQGSLLNN